MTSLILPIVPGGRIEIIMGPMFSGKTTELMRRIRTYTVAKKRAHVVKYSKDLRKPGSDFSIVNHDGFSYPASPCGAQDLALPEITTALMEFDVIGIDEAQFFTNLASFAEYMANVGRIVVIAGLNSTFERKNFGEMGNLIPIADQITMLKAVCSVCYREASFSRRITNSTVLEEIGGSDKYEARCRNCFSI